MKFTQQLKISLTAISIAILFLSCKNSKSEQIASNEIIKVEYPESYELANIILALTDYGKTDIGEVRKGFDYYHKVQEYFKPVMEHPLLDSVNYSRERWEDYLSFRTDSYVFKFNENHKLIRTTEFYTNKGFHPFDDHLDLINDFVEKSNFRDFFAQNKEYHKALSAKYKKTQFLNEMRNFLITEFGEQYSNDEKYNIVLSPFVGRMNCHRSIDSTTVADFITIPEYVVFDTISKNRKNTAISIHNLFTEMDHGYVNPTTSQWKDLFTEKFDAQLWDHESGYNESDGYESSGSAVFNEYMTWAVYDIFLKKHFPELADEVSLYWSFQNNTRGFLYPQLFSQKLMELYNQKGKDENIKDLYPKMLEWTSEIQKDLSKPEIALLKSGLIARFSDRTKITIPFSEPMKKTAKITTIFQDGKNQKEFIELNVTEHNLQWSEDGLSFQFEFNLPREKDEYYFQFNWWETKYPLISKKGVLIKSGSFFKVTDE